MGLLPILLATVLADASQRDDWTPALRAYLDREERAIRPERGSDAWIASDPGAQLAFRWSPEGGVDVFPAIPIPAWQWGLRLVALEREGSAEVPVGVLASARRGPVAEWEWEGSGARVLETWRNEVGGLRHEVLLEEMPPGRRPLRLTFEVPPGWTAQVEDGGASASLVHATGTRLRWGGLAAWDADGRDLPVWLEAEGAGLVYALDDGGARYPVTLDPVLATFPPPVSPCCEEGPSTTPEWTVESNQAGAALGAWVAPAGDVDGDGYDDALVGVPGWDVTLNGNEGRALLFRGSATGLAGAAAWTFEGDQIDAGAGTVVASAGDVNGDGYADALVAAPAYSAGQTSEGRAWLFLGGASGLSTTASWTVDGEQNGAGFGESIAGVRDVDADGYGDVLVGAPGWDEGATTDAGKAALFLGGSTGLASTPSWSAAGSGSPLSFGRSVAGAGDVNRDGYADVAIGADAGSGAVYSYHGGPGGLPGAPTTTLPGDQPGSGFGGSVAGVGDVDGDGYGDVVVGAPLYDAGSIDEGRAYLFRGGSTGLVVTAWTTESNQAGALHGSRVAAAGDVDTDGYADVAVVAQAFNTGTGRAFVYLGDAGGLATTAAWTADGSAGLAHAVTAGDVHGDGNADLLLGVATFSSPEAGEGQARLYPGNPQGLSSAAGWSVQSNIRDAQYGVSVAAAGDVNGDGFGDVVVGSNRYDNGQSEEGRAWLYLGSATGISTTQTWAWESNQAIARAGISVAGVGDLDGDGYDEVAVGANLWNGSLTDEGAVFVFRGSATFGAGGLPASPDWTLLGGQAGAQFGVSVAGAGDVNADGFGDLVAGAWKWGDGVTGLTDEGAIYVFHGGPSGPATTPSWSATGGQASSEFGYNVSAVDVNGDGYSDVVTGADAWANPQVDEGKGFLWRGGPTGLESSPAWTYETDLANAGFGFAIAGAGDVDGDGYGDVVAGAPLLTNGQTNEGRVYLFRGGSAGLASLPVWTWEPDRTANAGWSVGHAGDVNGDGYADIVVGAQLYTNADNSEGKAYVFHGGPSGPAAISPGADFSTPELNDASAFQGFSVAGAGDVNGDGFGDVIVGAYAYDSQANQADEGRADLFYGNDGHGRPVRLRQWRVDGTGPVGLRGRSGADGKVRLRGFAASPFGGGCVATGADPLVKQRTCHRVQFEVRRAATAWSPTCVTDDSGTCTTSGPLASDAEADVIVAGLFVRRYHWRARVLYPAGAIPAAGRWIEYPDPNPAFETDVIAASDLTPLAAPIADLAARADAAGVELSWVVLDPAPVARIGVEREDSGVWSPVGEPFMASASWAPSTPQGLLDTAGAVGTAYRLAVAGWDGEVDYVGPVWAVSDDADDAAPGCGCAIDPRSTSRSLLVPAFVLAMALAATRAAHPARRR